MPNKQLLHRISASLSQTLAAAIGLLLIFLLLRHPALSVSYAGVGLTLWFQKMIPTLLPFMILSGILTRRNLTERFAGALHPLFHLLYGVSKNGSYTIFMGFLCGFPMGARIVAELYSAGKLTKEEAQGLLCFCNQIGPIYFLSFVAQTLALKSTLLPFALMYGIPLLYGIPLMRWQRGAQAKPRLTLQPPAPMPLLQALDESILSGLLGIAKLGGYMIFFNLLNILFVPFSRLPAGLLCLYNCLLEITSGIERCGQSHPYTALILLPFGGFSCVAQTYSCIRHTDLSLRPYLWHKLAQTGLTALCYLLLKPF